MNIGILIVDDHKIFREGLRTLLEQSNEVEVLGEARNGREAVAMIQKLRPDVVIMDVAMPDLNGMDATHRIRREFPDTRVLALSMHADRRFVREMLHAGASGYLLKDCAFEELTLAIQTIREGKVYLSPDVAGDIVNDYLETNGEPGTARPALTPREREVLQLLAEGHSTKECASELGVSVKPIETHRKRIMDKLELRGVAELTKYAIREGYTSL